MHNDAAAWHAYPEYWHFFNKLWLNQQVGNCCAPAGIAVPITDWYITRPVYNISGMGAGAKKRWLTVSNSECDIPAGYFWCEWINGDHVSVDYTWQDGWQQLYAFQGHRNSGDPLYRFQRWQRVETDLTPPDFLDELKSVPVINVEYIAGRVIEVHLRASPDPVQWNEFVPVWQSQPLPAVQMQQQGYTWINSKDNANGAIPDQRLGFWVR